MWRPPAAHGDCCAVNGGEQDMRQGRRYFRHRRGTPVVVAGALESPRRPGLLLWLSGLAVLLYVGQLYIS